MFSQLGDKLQEIFKDLRGHGTISEENIDAALRQVRLALLEADVDFQVAKKFIARVKEKALGEAVLRSITPGQQIVKIFYDELSTLLGGDAAPLNLGEPHRILIVGLNGSGKTTSAAKLARLLKKQGRSPNLVALDLERPAAIEQLATLGKQIDVPVFTPDLKEKNVQRAATAALEWHERAGGNIDIFDTAGRQEVDVALVEELQQLKRFLQPQETLLVVDAATGQQAVSVATH
ncbi:MAG TPA: signal recognition particle receptor subunit alpha, partial [Chthoniobacterales bacterium]|nr:signal recognition particle receptor subunit alpha [Chthoniobacterales bacterium]